MDAQRSMDLRGMVALFFCRLGRSVGRSMISHMPISNLDHAWSGAGWGHSISYQGEVIHPRTTENPGLTPKLPG